MPYDSQGNFTRVMNWQDDAANGVAIVASRHDDEDDNFAQGFNEVVCRDGRAPMTGALKMGGFKITGMANGTTANDAVNKSQLDGVQTTLTTAISTAINTMLASLYPVGSIYVGTQSTCPLATLIAGSTWTKVPSSRVLQTSSSNHAANTTMEAGLPNITGMMPEAHGNTTPPSPTGAFTKRNSTWSARVGSGANDDWGNYYDFDASKSNSIYGKSTTVQPAAYIVNVWRRTA